MDPTSRTVPDQPNCARTSQASPSRRSSRVPTTMAIATYGCSPHSSASNTSGHTACNCFWSNTSCSQVSASSSAKNLTAAACAVPWPSSHWPGRTTAPLPPVPSGGASQATVSLSCIQPANTHTTRSYTVPSVENISGFILSKPRYLLPSKMARGAREGRSAHRVGELMNE